MADLTQNSGLSESLGEGDGSPSLDALSLVPDGDFGQDAKLWMRLKFMEQVANGASDADLSRLRSTISDSQGWSKIPVAATCAHVWIKADKVLEAFKLNEDISREDFVTLTFRVLAAQECISDRTDPLQEFPQGLRQSLLAAVTEYTAHLFGPRYPFDTNAEALEVSPISKPVRGSQVDYDNPTKQAWGYTELDFIARHTNPEWLAKSAILVLPGKECHELDRLLRLPGVNPKNIIAVEGDSSVHDEFERNARARGVTPYPAQLEKLLPSLQGRLGVVMLDFHGNTCQKNLSILEQLPLADRALVLINVMIGRESGAAKGLLSAVYDDAFNNRLGDLVAAWRAAELGSNGDVEAAANVFQSAMDQRDSEVQLPALTEIRNDVLDNIFLGRIESARKRPSRLVVQKGRGYFARADEIVNSQEQIMFRGMLLDVARMLSGVIRKVSDYGSLESSPDLTGSLTRWADNVIFTNPLVKQLEKFGYQSETGSKKRFYSSFAVIEKPRDLYKQGVGSVRFILQCVKAMWDEHQRTGLSTEQKFSFLRLSTRPTRSEKLQVYE